MNQELINYIRENLAKGVPQDQIRQSLLTSGWKQADIDAAFVQLDAPPSSLPPFPIKPPSAQTPPLRVKEPKSFFNPKILIAAIAVIFLLTAGGGFYFFVFKEKSPATENPVKKQNQQGITTETPNQTGSNQDQVKPQTPQTQNPTSGKDYAACFSKYDEKFMPEAIGEYRLATTWDKSLFPKENFQPKGPQHMELKVRWGLTGLYEKSGGAKLLFAIEEAVEENNPEFTRLKQYLNYTNDVIENLPVGATYDSTSDSEIHTLVPGTTILIDMEFKPQEARAREFFSNWLNSVCP